jgi:NADH-quinone oxidoreductase subunit J
VIEQSLLALFAVITFGCGLRVVSSNDLVHCVLWLGIVLVMTAGIFLLLGAPFLAGVQLLLYTGGVITLMLFGVMLTRRHHDIGVEIDSSRKLPAALTAGSLFALMAVAITSTPLPPLLPANPVAAIEIGRAFLTDHLLAFEVLSLLLLAAMVGAITLGRRHDFGDEPPMHPNQRRGAAVSRRGPKS